MAEQTPGSDMRHFVIHSEAGARLWHADALADAEDQHRDAFGDDVEELILGVDDCGPCPNPDSPETC